MRGIRSTDVRREPDARLLALGLAGPGNDTRQWCDYGTVASVSERDGQPDFTDPNAIVISQEGVDVDVVFGVDQSPVTCRYGTQCGIGVILTPIRPGDLVLVAVPGGELGNVPVILQIVPGPHTPLPLESEDHKPVFRNDRVSIMARGVPIEVRTTGGGKVTIDEDSVVVTNPNEARVEVAGDGKVHLSTRDGATVDLDGQEVNLNQGTQGGARLADTVQVTISSVELAALATALLATGVFTPSGNLPAPGPPVPLQNGTITSASGTVKVGG